MAGLAVADNLLEQRQNVVKWAVNCNAAQCHLLEVLLQEDHAGCAIVLDPTARYFVFRVRLADILKRLNRNL